MPASAPHWRLVWSLLPLAAVAACAVLALRAEREALLRETRAQAQNVCDAMAQDFLRALAREGPRPLPSVNDQGRLVEGGFLYPDPPLPPPGPASPAQAWFDAGDYERVLTQAPDALSPAGLPLATLCAWRLMVKEEDPARLPARWQALVREAVQRHPCVISPDLLRQAETRLRQHGRLPPVGNFTSAWRQWEADTRLRALLRQHAQALRYPRAGWLGPVEKPAAWVFSAADAPANDTPAAWHVLPREPVEELAGACLRRAAATLPAYVIPRITLRPVVFGPPTAAGEEPLALTERADVRVSAVCQPTREFHLAVLRHMQWTGGALGLAFLACAFGAWQTHRAMRRQELLALQKTNFLSSVSHELRTPLASLRLMAESLLNGTVTDPARRNQYHEVMLEECTRLSSLVDKVLDFARMERGARAWCPEPVEPAQIIADAIRVMNPRAERHRIAWETRCADFAPLPRADKEALHQALLNLLDNALKHTPEGSTLTLHAAPVEGGRWTLGVADEGPGIPPAERLKVLDLFYRSGSELRRETTGAGLGLAIVRHIAEGHGGGVTIQDAAGGRGALVLLTLNLNPAAAATPP